MHTHCFLLHSSSCYFYGSFRKILSTSLAFCLSAFWITALSTLRRIAVLEFKIPWKISFVREIDVLDNYNHLQEIKRNNELANIKKIILMCTLLNKTECVFDARFIFIVEKIRPAIRVMCISLQSLNGF